MFKPIPLEVARKLFLVKDGKLVHRATSHARQVIAGEEAGSAGVRGYRQVDITTHGKFYVHRVIYALENNLSVFDEIDHKNRIKDYNTPENLRESTRSQNMHNTYIYANNTTGYRGVSFHKNKNKFQAYIKVHGKRIYLGFHPTAEIASAARKSAAIQHGVEL